MYRRHGGPDAKSKARFSLRMREPAILLNADWQEWDRKGDHQLNGYVTSDRTLVLKRTKRKGFGGRRAGGAASFRRDAEESDSRRPAGRDRPGRNGFRAHAAGVPGPGGAGGGVRVRAAERDCGAR